MTLKEFRKELGLTQIEFGEWLAQKGLFGRNGDAYGCRTIAAWESGRRNVPTKVKNIIEAENKEKPLQIKISEVIEELKQTKTPLADYTTKELLEEIERRCGK